MMSLKEIGPWAYIVGVVVSLLMGFISPTNSAVAVLLGVLGLVVGLLNIQDKEVSTFLLASIAFLVSASSLSTLVIRLGALSGMSEIAAVTNGLASALYYLVAFTAPAAALIAILALYRLSKD